MYLRFTFEVLSGAFCFHHTWALLWLIPLACPAIIGLTGAISHHLRASGVRLSTTVLAPWRPHALLGYPPVRYVAAHARSLCQHATSVLSIALQWLSWSKGVWQVKLKIRLVKLPNKTNNDSAISSNFYSNNKRTNSETAFP